MLRIFPGQVSKLPMNEMKDFQTSGESNIYFSTLKSVNHRETTHNTETCLRNDLISSMLRQGLRLICIKSYNDHKIYQSLPKFGNLGKIGNLNFPVR